MSAVPQLVRQNREGATLYAGVPVCRAANGVRLASASDASRFPVVGLVVVKRAANMPVTITQAGSFKLSNWTRVIGQALLDTGSMYYLSATPGRLTTNPSEPGAVASQFVGIPISETTLQLRLGLPASIIVNGANVALPGKATVGQVQIQDGSEGVGKVLTSDADGNGLWQNPGATSLTSGTCDLGAGVEGGSVAGLALGWVPARVMLTVRKPASGFNLYASIVDGTITENGFDFVLSGQTDSADYKLDYLLIP